MIADHNTTSWAYTLGARDCSALALAVEVIDRADVFDDLWEINV